MPREDVIAELKAQGAAAFEQSMRGAATSVEGVGGAAGKAAQQTETAAKRSHRSLLKWGAAAVALNRGYAFIKGAVNDTQALAKQTAGLQRVTGMDARTASTWAATAKERGIAATSLQRGFLTLGKQVMAAGQGSVKARTRVQALAEQLTKLEAEPTKGAKALRKQAEAVAKLKDRMAAASRQTGTQAKLFQQLGLSQRELTTGNTEAIMERVADALLKIDDPLQRAAIGQRLFGRAYLQLAPILSKGAKGIRDNREEMEKSGDVLDQAGVDRAMDAVKAQRALGRTMDGLKITLATTLLPTISKLAQSFQGVLEESRPLLLLIQRYPGPTAAVAGAIIGVVSAFKLANWAVRTFNLTIAANPIALVIIAIAGLVIGFVILYRRVAWFRNAVNAAWDKIKSAAVFVFNFIREHWKALLVILGGPIGAVVLGIVTHFGQVKHAAHELWVGVRQVFNAVVAIVQRAWGLIRPVVDKLSSGVGAVASAGGKVAGFIGSVGGSIPGFGLGGVSPGGAALVGEYGPELVSLPAGARVTPLSGPAAPGAIDLAAAIGNLNVHSVLMVDRRVLAESTGRAVADRQARR